MGSFLQKFDGFSKRFENSKIFSGFNGFLTKKNRPPQAKNLRMNWPSYAWLSHIKLFIIKVYH